MRTQPLPFGGEGASGSFGNEYNVGSSIARQIFSSGLTSRPQITG